MLQVEQILQNRYKLERQLSKNAARQTWLATDLQANEDGENAQVVVKLLAFGGDIQWDDLKLFEREAQILKQLNHLRIPKYIDYFSVDDRILWFGLVEEYIPGESLKDCLEQGKRFTEKQVKQIAIEVLNILIYLHELNPAVLHRDIKPSNLIWGEDEHIYLVDFGAVQDKAVKEGVTFTVVGTYGYAPIEQFGGKAVPASDLYALGATLVHLLTGISPAELPQSDLRMQFSDYVNIQPSFLNWLEQMTEPSVERRFSSTRQALETLKDNRLFNNLILRSIRQPADSFVQLRKTSKQLLIKLPQQRLSGLQIFGFAVKTLIMGVIGISFLSFVMSIFVLGITLPFFLIWLAILYQVLLSTFGYQKVIFTKDFFAIELWLFNFCVNRKADQTSDVQDVFQSVLRTGAKSRFQLENLEDKEMVTIQTEYKRYSFGVGLSAMECVWLAQEIKDWLRLNSH